MNQTRCSTLPISSSSVNSSTQVFFFYCAMLMVKGRASLPKFSRVDMILISIKTGSRYSVTLSSVQWSLTSGIHSLERSCGPPLDKQKDGMIAGSLKMTWRLLVSHNNCILTFTVVQRSWCIINILLCLTQHLWLWCMVVVCRSYSQSLLSNWLFFTY